MEFFDFFDHLRNGGAYLSAVREDEELAEQLVNLPRPKALKSPPFYGFTDERYDFARIEALLHMAVIAAMRGDPSKAGIEPNIPVPAVDRIRRDRNRRRLGVWVMRITGEED